MNFAIEHIDTDDVERLGYWFKSRRDFYENVIEIEHDNALWVLEEDEDGIAIRHEGYHVALLQEGVVIETPYCTDEDYVVRAWEGNGDKIAAVVNQAIEQIE